MKSLSMQQLTYLAVLVVQFCWVTQGRQLPILLDFEELQINDAATNHTVGSSYSRNGLQLTTVQRSPTQFEDFNYPGTLSSIFIGSTTLFHHISGGKMILSRIDGSLFDLISIHIAEIPTGDSNGQPIDFGSFDITFIGTRTDASTISETFTAQSFPRVTTFQFSNFTDLVSVHWFQGAGGGPGLRHINLIMCSSRARPSLSPATTMMTASRTPKTSALTR